jgi:hypothetical protein
MDCNVVKKNMGLVNCNKLPALIKGMIVTPQSFSVTEVQALLATTWQNAMIAEASDRIHLWPPFINMENISEEAVYEDLPLGYLPVRDGNYRFRFSVRQNMCIHKAMFTHRTNAGRAFLFDTENQLIGTQDSEGNIRGLSIQLLHTEKMVFSDGSVSTKSPFVLALLDNKELDRDGVLFDAGFVNSLDRIVQAKITIISTADDEIVADVAVECDGTPLSGLLAADFVLTDGDGDAQSISGATENNGRYTLTGTGLVSGTLGLRDVTLLTVDYYEADEVAVTIAS